MVGASLTTGKFGRIGQFIDLVNGQHSGLIVFFVAFSGNQGTTESTHDTGDVRSYCLAAGNALERTKHGVIVKSTALYDNVFSEFFRIGEFDNLKEGIFDHGISKTGRNISHGRTFLLRLLYLGVHKYRTSCTKINRILGKQGFLSKIRNGKVQRFCKSLDKGSATGRTCLIQLHAVNGLVLDLDAFHILSADV